MEGFESLVGMDFWTALLTLCNMIITFAVLKKFLFKPVKKMIDDRQQEIDHLYADADNSKAQAEALQAQYAAKLKAAGAEGDRIIQNATRQAQKQRRSHRAGGSGQGRQNHGAGSCANRIRKKASAERFEEPGLRYGFGDCFRRSEEEIDQKKHAELIHSFIENLGETS